LIIKLLLVFNVNRRREDVAEEEDEDTIGKEK
jgi:hypothetical protein